MHSKFNMKQWNIEDYIDLKAAVCVSHFATTRMNICEFVYVYKSITYLVFFILNILWKYRYIYIYMYICCLVAKSCLTLL